MADVNKAIEFMLHQEDAKLSGAVTNLKDDRGGATRFGLCAKFHPALVEAGFFDGARVSRERGLVLAKDAYTKEYAIPLRLDALKSDAVACTILSFAVNGGIGTALKLLRDALNTFGYNLPVNALPEDDATFEAENEVPEKKLVPALVQHQRARYEQIVAHDPSQGKWFKGWMNRANQALALVEG